MKKILSITLTILSITAMKSQDVTNALPFSQDNLNGTARFRAMSGAFGALGGDLSSIGINPAGSAIFVNNQLGFTLTNYSVSNKSLYQGSRYTENDNNFSMNQVGAVFVFHNQNRNTDWKKFSVAVNYDNVNNFDSKDFIIGNNLNHSVSQYFVNKANGIPENILNFSPYNQLNYPAQQAALAYNAYIISPDGSVTNKDEPGSYVSNMEGNNNFHQEISASSSGYNGKLAFNFATQYEDWLYLGLNLNTYFIDYKKSVSFYEDTKDSSPENHSNIKAKELRYNNNLHTSGSGFSFQLGAIAKPIEEVRFGLTYQSPTWYRLNDEITHDISSLSVDGNNNVINKRFDPGVVNLFPTYRLRNPSTYTGSFAYIFGQSGLLSIDYAVKDYRNVKVSPESSFNNFNDEMANALQLNSELRVGAEYRIKNVSFRGGYRYEQSPYKTGKIIGDLQGFSAGIGFNFGSTKLDFAYAYAKRNYDQTFYGLPNIATTKSINNNVSVSLLFEL